MKFKNREYIETMAYTIVNLILFCLLLFIMASCKSGGNLTVDVCISDVASGGFQCVNKQRQPYFLPYVDSDNYVAFSPDDARQLLQSCKPMTQSQMAKIDSEARKIKPTW